MTFVVCSPIWCDHWGKGSECIFLRRTFLALLLLSPVQVNILLSPRDTAQQTITVIGKISAQWKILWFFRKLNLKEYFSLRVARLFILKFCNFFFYLFSHYHFPSVCKPIDAMYRCCLEWILIAPFFRLQNDDANNNNRSARWNRLGLVLGFLRSANRPQKSRA